MNTLALITDGVNKLDEFLIENLKMVLEDYVDIHGYYIKDLKKCNVIYEDVILVMIKEKIKDVIDYVDDPKKILVIKRSVTHDQVYKLFSIPKDTMVLVVNDNDKTSVETVNVLKTIGIKHLNLIPYIKGKDYSDMNIAVTPGERQKVPDYINNIIDVGNRYIDISTFYEMLDFLQLNNHTIYRNLLKYAENVVNLELGVRDIYKQLFVENIELSSIIDLSENGMIFVSNLNNVRLMNRSAMLLLGARPDVLGKNIEDIKDDNIRKLFILFSCSTEFQGDTVGINTKKFMDHDIDVEYVFSKQMNKEIRKSDAIKFKDKFLNISSYEITQFEKFIGTYYCIQDKTYIKKLEQNLSKKLKSKGQFARYTFSNFYTNSESFLKVIELGKRIAKLEQTVLITGESGTGKEIMAQSIHSASNRSNQPFVAVNCAAISENLLESELFGYEAGSFTGALKDGKTGFFEQAHNGTLFLDEIGDMQMSLQTKLLRVLQENQVTRVGGSSIIDVDVRVIAATNVDLSKKIEDGKFRKDLYYRLNVLPINLPPLREHKDDIIHSLNLFMKTAKKFSKETVNLFYEYNWPGNMRELVNLGQYLDAICISDTVTLDILPVDFKRFLKDINQDRLGYLKTNQNSEGIKNATTDSDFDNSKSNQIKSSIKLRQNITSEELKKELLTIIFDYNSREIGIGREFIRNALADKNIIASETVIKKNLKILKDDGFIISGRGRAGSFITDEGKEKLKKY